MTAAGYQENRCLSARLNGMHSICLLLDSLCQRFDLPNIPPLFCVLLAAMFDCIIRILFIYLSLIKFSFYINLETNNQHYFLELAYSYKLFFSYYIIDVINIGRNPLG